MITENQISCEQTTQNKTSNKQTPPPQTQQTPSAFTFTQKQLSSHLLDVTITVSASLVDQLVTSTANLFRSGNFDGFEQENIPLEYIKETYKSIIDKQVKSYLFHHYVIDFLYSQIIAKKISVANRPRLEAIENSKQGTLEFQFQISTIDPLEPKEWKHFTFRIPKRKRYKDLDKQVSCFIDQESQAPKGQNLDIIQDTDWVFFDVAIVDEKNEPLALLSTSFWAMARGEESPNSLAAEFIGKKTNDAFLSNYFEGTNSDQLPYLCNYKFLIIIKTIVKGSTFSMDTFKTTFKLKNRSEIHNKLIEVFSYRNDISQRRSIIEEVFHLLLSKHRFEIPKHLVLRREEDLLYAISQKPDYYVYKSQKNFHSTIEQLAEKQLKEEIIIDHISYHENISINMKDVHQYLHFFANQRLKEFVYFKPLFFRLEDVEHPFNTSFISQFVLREKTLNYVIHTLTR